MATGSQAVPSKPRWWKAKRSWYDAFVNLARAATFVALCLAVVQWWDSKQIIEGLSTTYVGKFPDGFSALAEFVAADQGNFRELDVIADFAAAGEYSADRDDFNKYFHQLERPPKNAKVNLLIYSNSLQEKVVLPRQFSDGEFKKEKTAAKSKDSESLLISYFKQHDKDLRAPCSTGSDAAFYENLERQVFLKMLMYTETDYQSRLNGDSTEVRFSDQEFPFFLWLKDDKEAIFGIYRPEDLLPDNTAFTVYFKTRDQKLIETYRQLFRALWKKSDPKLRADSGKQFKITPVAATEFTSLCKK